MYSFFTILAAATARADDGSIATRYVLLAYDPVNDLTTTLARAIIGQPDTACPTIDIKERAMPRRARLP